MLKIFIGIIFIIVVMIAVYKLFRKINRSKQIILILFIVVTVFIALFINYSNTENIARAVQSIKNLVKLPSQYASVYIEDDDDVAIIKIENKVLIDAPIINQYPELPRGCEVTSLAMLLQHVDIDVDKMTLAEEIKKDPSPYRTEGGKIHFGHPNDGFVGNMYTYDKPGLGVYHQPIKELADQYLPGKMIDLTGSSFDELKIHLSDGRPVWVIINTAYRKLPEGYFQTWQTAQGEIEITYKEHSVLVTGYDDKYIYFNDPLIGKKNRKEPIEGFIDAWIQMGRQAITYLP